MSVLDDRVLELAVVEELQAGNWPDCPTCRQLRRDHTLQYVGIVSHAPTFMCETCSTIFAMDLHEPPI